MIKVNGHVGHLYVEMRLVGFVIFLWGGIFHCCLRFVRCCESKVASLYLRNEVVKYLVAWEFTFISKLF